jgi:hypothetical protein
MAVMKSVSPLASITPLVIPVVALTAHGPGAGA